MAVPRVPYAICEIRKSTEEENARIGGRKPKPVLSAE